ncbi:PF06439 domain protein [Bacteroidetes bacterium oral taxon 272 str. F0290]|nr:PF06439 domain protein [Bacteroidetes bacterium oral taxon 272 str. F0290]
MKTSMLKLKTLLALPLIGCSTTIAMTVNETDATAASDTTICISKVLHQYTPEGKEPLYLIDDVLVDQATVGKLMLGSIESVQLLKEDTPMTHYGKEAENGVVIITTKKYAEEKAKISQTPENRLIRLKEQIEKTSSTERKRDLLKSIGQTGTFQAMVYIAKYMNDEMLKQTAAEAVKDIALNHEEYNGVNTRNYLKQAQKILNDKQAKQEIQHYLKRVSTKEKGYVAIFNGKDLTGWKGLVENPIQRAKMTKKESTQKQIKADEAMRNDWTVEDGSLTYIGKGFDNLCTVKQYGDFEMYVDWKLDSHGSEPDAGIYLRGTPQVQIWDVTRINAGAQVGSGGLYNNQKNRSTPLKVADNKLNEWNSFYIKMIGDKVTVYLNGVLVVDNVPLENFWDRKSPIFPKEQIELQAHGSKVYFKNIYVKEL